LALAVPLSRFTSQVGGGSAFFVRRHSHFMKNCTPLIIAALLVSLFIGCSKHSPTATPANPNVTDLGVVEVSDGIPIYHDLGGSKACVISPTVFRNGSVKLSFTIQQTNSAGVVETLATPSVQNMSGSPMHVYVGGISISVTPKIKP
jgi:Flp pilus assembly secretin CpaC